MMRQSAFLVLLILSSLYAGLRGGRPEQIGAASLLGGALLSTLVVNPFGGSFRFVETGMLLIDIAILGSFLWLSIRSTRFWPLWIAAMLGAEVIVHLMRAIMPAIIPQAYIDGLAIWSWIIQLMLVAGTWRHQRRLARLGADASWKS